MHEHRGELVTLVNHPRQLRGIELEEVRALLSDDVAGRRFDPRVRQHAGDVPAVPLHDNARPGAAIDANGQMTLEDDVQNLAPVRRST